MPLLAVEQVTKRYVRGRRERVALKDVSFGLQAGELAVVLGERRSGRSTLMRIAAGIERPDEGRVLFDGADLASAGRRALGRTLGFCMPSFSTMEGDLVLDHVAAPLLAQGMTRASARTIAAGALERAGAADCATALPDELDTLERMRVAIARGLAPRPKLLVIDDPTTHKGSVRRDPVLRLLNDIVEEGPSVLMSTDDGLSISGARRVFVLEGGMLRSQLEPQTSPTSPPPAPDPATVVSLDTRRASA